MEKSHVFWVALLRGHVAKKKLGWESPVNVCPFYNLLYFVVPFFFFTSLLAAREDANKGLNFYVGRGRFFLATRLTLLSIPRYPLESEKAKKPIKIFPVREYILVPSTILDFTTQEKRKKWEWRSKFNCVSQLVACDFEIDRQAVKISVDARSLIFLQN